MRPRVSSGGKGRVETANLQGVKGVLRDPKLVIECHRVDAIHSLQLHLDDILILVRDRVKVVQSNPEFFVGIAVRFLHLNPGTVEEVDGISELTPGKNGCPSIAAVHGNVAAAAGDVDGVDATAGNLRTIHVDFAIVYFRLRSHCCCCRHLSLWC